MLNVSQAENGIIDFHIFQYYRTIQWNSMRCCKRKQEGIDMSNENTNWGQGVAGVVIKDNKVLLARHTYGNGKGMLT